MPDVQLDRGWESEIELGRHGVLIFLLFPDEVPPLPGYLLFY